jgi:hypothetical protein
MFNYTNEILYLAFILKLLGWNGEKLSGDEVITARAKR